MPTRYGYDLDVWDRAKEEVRTLLIQTAKQQATLAYSEVTQRIKTIVFEPDSHAFHTMLGEISREEDEAGRGMLSALVTHKDGTQPGGGFFELARQLGRDVADRDQCWIRALTQVQEYWAKH